MRRLTGKVVLITGATGGLGTAVTESFLNAGSQVAGAARSWKHESGEVERLLRIEADLTTPSDARQCLDAVTAEYGRVDVLVHLVGGFAGGKSVAQTPDDTWERMLRLNLRSANLMFRTVLPPMIEARRGRIIAVGSKTGVEPAANMAAYCASKAALHALIQCLAAEVGKDGITANAVLPSVIDTPANRSAMPSADFSRWVTPESIADLILWLASDEAADVNGALIPIYGRV